MLPDSILHYLLQSSRAVGGNDCQRTGGALLEGGPTGCSAAVALQGSHQHLTPCVRGTP
jgi:hypothetical protein